SASAAPATSSSAAATDEKPGIDAKDNNSKIVEATKKILSSCDTKWSADKGYGLDLDCDAVKALSEMTIDKGKDDTTFVKLVEDKNEKVRWVGWYGLMRWGDAYKGDKALAERVVGAAERETGKSFDGALGTTVANIKHDKTSLGPRIKDLAMNEKVSADLRAG